MGGRGRGRELSIWPQGHEVCLKERTHGHLLFVYDLCFEWSFLNLENLEVPYIQNSDFLLEWYKYLKLASHVLYAICSCRLHYWWWSLAYIQVTKGVQCPWKITTTFFVSASLNSLMLNGQWFYIFSAWCFQGVLYRLADTLGWEECKDWCWFYCISPGKDIVTEWLCCALCMSSSSNLFLLLKYLCASNCITFFLFMIF